MHAGVAGQASTHLGQVVQLSARSGQQGRHLVCGAPLLAGLARGGKEWGRGVSSSSSASQAAAARSTHRQRQHPRHPPPAPAPAPTRPAGAPTCLYSSSAASTAVFRVSRGRRTTSPVSQSSTSTAAAPGSMLGG